MRAWGLVIGLMLLAGCIQIEIPTVPVSPTIREQGVDAYKGPVADFSWTPEFPRAREPVQFKPEVQVLRGTNVTAWSWSWGDGTSDSTATPKHTYATAGDRFVTLRLRTSDGLQAVAQHKVMVLGPRDGPAGGPGGNDGGAPPGELPAGGNATVVAPLPEGVPEGIHAEVLALRTAILDANGERAVRLDARQVDTLAGFDSWGAGRSFQAVLTPGLVLPAEAWAEVDGQPVARPFVEVYEGHLEGDSGSLVRVTLAKDWARGSVRSGDREYLLRINLAENLPEGSAASRSAALSPPSPPPRLVDGPHWDDEETCTGGLSGWAPLTVTPVTDVGRSPLPAIQTKVILDGDARYLEQLGEDAMPLMVAILNEMDMVYDYEVGVRFQVVGLHLNTDRGYYPDPEVTAPLAKLEDYWAQRHREERDIVHLFTGYPSSFAQANCIGGAGSPAGVTFTPIEWEGEYTVFHTHALAHEFGHLFAAHHHYGNHAEAELATIMIQGYTPGAQPVFGTLERSVIRGWAEQML